MTLKGHINLKPLNNIIIYKLVPKPLESVIICDLKQFHFNFKIITFCLINHLVIQMITKVTIYGFQNLILSKKAILNPVHTNV